MAILNIRKKAERLGIDVGENNIPQAEEMMYSNYMKQDGYHVSDIDIDNFKKGAEGSKET